MDNHVQTGTIFRTDVAIAFSSTCLPAPVFFLLLVYWFILFSKARDRPVLEEKLNETSARKHSHDESPMVVLTAPFSTPSGTSAQTKRRFSTKEHGSQNGWVV
jgi:hypothetical protein